MRPQVSITSMTQTRPIRRKMLGRTCLAGALLLSFASGGVALADHTSASAELTAHGGAEGTCAEETCSQAACTATLDAVCVDGMCTLSASLLCDIPCAGTWDGAEVALYSSGDTTCDAMKANLLVDFTTANLDISESEWKTAISGSGLVTASQGPGAGGTAKASGSLFKTTTPVPTVSDWGMLVMLVLVLAVGSVLYRRRLARC